MPKAPAEPRSPNAGQAGERMRRVARALCGGKNPFPARLGCGG
jgi:hypothetical protein